MARRWPYFRPEVTIGVIGDLHHGLIYPNDRLGKILEDLDNLPEPKAFVQVGDLINTSTAYLTQDPLAKAWVDALPAPVHVIPGNHDIQGGGRTVEQWADDWDVPVNYAVDLGFAILLAVFIDVNTTVPTSSLTWLDVQLAAADKDCIVVCHPPIKGTCDGASPHEGASVISSNDAGFWVQYPDADSSDMTDILSAHSSAKVYICGHTHTPMDVSGMVTPILMGGRGLIHINASAPIWTTTVANVDNPIRTLYVSYLEDTVEVRCRNHGARVWDAPFDGDHVVTLSIPD